MVGSINLQKAPYWGHLFVLPKHCSWRNEFLFDPTVQECDRFALVTYSDSFKLAKMTTVNKAKATTSILSISYRSGSNLCRGLLKGSVSMHANNIISHLHDDALNY